MWIWIWRLEALRRVNRKRDGLYTLETSIKIRGGREKLSPVLRRDYKPLFVHVPVRKLKCVLHNPFCFVWGNKWLRPYANAMGK